MIIKGGRTVLFNTKCPMKPDGDDGLFDSDQRRGNTDLKVT